MVTAGRPITSKGAALLLVLWMLTLSTIMAGSFALTMQRELSIAGNFKDSAQASALAEAGVNYAMLMLLHPDEAQRWSADSSIYEFEFEGAIIRVKIIDEAGKININNPDPELLRGALEFAGADPELQDKIIDGIQDWQDNDDQPRPQGAEADDYAAAGLSYGPGNQQFQVINELQMVLGMNADLYNLLEPILTVHSNTNKVDPTKAPREVLMVLPDMDEKMVDDYLEQRREIKQGAGKAQDTRAETNFPTARGASQQSSGVYTLIAEAMLDNGNSGKIKVLIKKTTSGGGLPFTVLEWNNAPLNEAPLF